MLDRPDTWSKDSRVIEAYLLAGKEKNKDILSKEDKTAIIKAAEALKPQKQEKPRVHDLNNQRYFF